MTIETSIETLVVARAFASRRASRPRDLVNPLLRFSPLDRTESQWRDALLAAVERLQRANVLDAECRLVEAGELARRIGKHGAKTWAQLSDKVLPGLGLGIAPSASKIHERLVGREAWAAAIAGRSLGLWTDGAPPSLPAVCDALVWRSLGLPSKPKRCPAEIRAYFVRQKLASGDGPADRQIFLLAAKAVGVVRSDLRVLRDALVRMWLTGDTSLSGDPEPVDEFDDDQITNVVGEPDFASDVLDVSRQVSDGVFGDRKVFISSVWDSLRHQPRWRSLSLDDFKQQLVRAHRAGDLVLARADLVAAMDPDLVAASETRTDGASFHFIVREAS